LPNEAILFYVKKTVSAMIFVTKHIDSISYVWIEQKEEIIHVHVTDNFFVGLG
jgi:hypothetical protein